MWQSISSYIGLSTTGSTENDNIVFRAGALYLTTIIDTKIKNGVVALNYDNLKDIATSIQNHPPTSLEVCGRTYEENKHYNYYKAIVYFLRNMAQTLATDAYNEKMKLIANGQTLTHFNHISDLISTNAHDFWNKLFHEGQLYNIPIVEPTNVRGIQAGQTRPSLGIAEDILRENIKKIEQEIPELIKSYETGKSKIKEMEDIIRFNFTNPNFREQYLAQVTELESIEDIYKTKVFERIEAYSNLKTNAPVIETLQKYEPKTLPTLRPTAPEKLPPPSPKRFPPSTVSRVSRLAFAETVEPYSGAGKEEEKKEHKPSEEQGKKEHKPTEEEGKEKIPVISVKAPPVYKPAFAYRTYSQRRGILKLNAKYKPQDVETATMERLKEMSELGNLNTLYEHRSRNPEPGSEMSDLGNQTSPWKLIYTPIEVDVVAKDLQFAMTDKSAKQHMLDFLADAGISDSTLSDLLAKENPTTQEKLFFRDFVLWLCGKPIELEDIERTPWLKQMYLNDEEWNYEKHGIPGEDVKKFLNSVIDARSRFAKELDILEHTFSGGLMNAYLYFKYIVRGGRLDSNSRNPVLEKEAIVSSWFGDFRYMLNQSEEFGGIITDLDRAKVLQEHYSKHSGGLGIVQETYPNRFERTKKIRDVMMPPILEKGEQRKNKVVTAQTGVVGEGGYIPPEAGQKVTSTSTTSEQTEGTSTSTSALSTSTTTSEQAGRLSGAEGAGRRQTSYFSFPSAKETEQSAHIERLSKELQEKEKRKEEEIAARTKQREKDLEQERIRKEETLRKEFEEQKRRIVESERETSEKEKEQAIKEIKAEIEARYSTGTEIADIRKELEKMHEEREREQQENIQLQRRFTERQEEIDRLNRRLSAMGGLDQEKRLLQQENEKLKIDMRRHNEIADQLKQSREAVVTLQTRVENITKQHEEKIKQMEQASLEKAAKEPTAETVKASYETRLQELTKENEETLEAMLKQVESYQEEIQKASLKVIELNNEYETLEMLRTERQEMVEKLGSGLQIALDMSEKVKAKIGKYTAQDVEKYLQQLHSTYRQYEILRGTGKPTPQGIVLPEVPDYPEDIPAEKSAVKIEALPATPPKQPPTKGTSKELALPTNMTFTPEDKQASSMIVARIKEEKKEASFSDIDLAEMAKLLGTINRFETGKIKSTNLERVAFISTDKFTKVPLITAKDRSVVPYSKTIPVHDLLLHAQKQLTMSKNLTYSAYNKTREPSFAKERWTKVLPDQVLLSNFTPEFLQEASKHADLEFTRTTVDAAKAFIDRFITSHANYIQKEVTRTITATKIEGEIIIPETFSNSLQKTMKLMDEAANHLKDRKVFSPTQYNIYHKYFDTSNPERKFTEQDVNRIFVFFNGIQNYKVDKQTETYLQNIWSQIALQLSDTAICADFSLRTKTAKTGEGARFSTKLIQPK